MSNENTIKFSRRPDALDSPVGERLPATLVSVTAAPHPTLPDQTVVQWTYELDQAGRGAALPPKISYSTGTIAARGNRLAAMLFALGVGPTAYLDQLDAESLIGTKVLAQVGQIYDPILGDAVPCIAGVFAFEAAVPFVLATVRPDGFERKERPLQHITNGDGLYIDNFKGDG